MDDLGVFNREWRRMQEEFISGGPQSVNRTLYLTLDEALDLFNKFGMLLDRDNVPVLESDFGTLTVQIV